MSQKTLVTLASVMLMACSSNRMEEKANVISHDAYAATVLTAKGLDGHPMFLSPFPAAKKGDTTGQIAEYITSMLQDKSGAIWMGMEEHGLARFKDTSFYYFSEKDGYKGSYVKDLAKDSSGHVWIASNEGVLEFDGKKFKRYTIEDGLLSNEVGSILVDRQQQVWCGTLNGLCRLRSKRFEPVTIPTQGGSSYIRINRDLVYDILEDRKDQLWFATDGGGLVKYDGKQYTQFLKKDGLPDENITSLLEDQQGQLWVGTNDGGLAVFDGKVFKVFGKKEGLFAEGVWCLMEDHKGRIWVGTMGGGAAFYDGQAFYTYLEKRGRTRNMVISLLETRNKRIYVSIAGGGLYEFNGESLINRNRDQLANCLPESDKLFPKDVPVNFVY